MTRVLVPIDNLLVTISAHAHSWIHRNAGKLLFAGGLLQPFYFINRLVKAIFFQLHSFLGYDTLITLFG
ncbi:hypothetical protein G7563_002164 [Salmonella enterica subsp. enterica]|nr:hypothetical protein [Salmonella enterica subsp. enterica serovar Hvittingfoss]